MGQIEFLDLIEGVLGEVPKAHGNYFGIKLTDKVETPACTLTAGNGTIQACGSIVHISTLSS